MLSLRCRGKCNNSYIWSLAKFCSISHQSLFHMTLMMAIVATEEQKEMSSTAKPEKRMTRMPMILEKKMKAMKKQEKIKNFLFWIAVL